MKKVILVMAALAVGILIATCASATMVIDFEGVNAPDLFRDATHLTELYAGMGVHFAGPGALDGGAILNENSGFGAPAHSGINFLAFNRGEVDGPAVMSDGGRPVDPETIMFDSPVMNFSMYVLGGLQAGVDLTVNAYDDSGVLVATSTHSVGGPFWSPVSVSWAGGIKSVVFQDRLDGRYAVDDISFGAVPEPGTILAALSILGPAGLIFRRRRV